MAITVYSPHSGHPVKVREADVGRAIRDEGGRIFYVVAREGGGGYYAALTRHGSARDEARYDDLAGRIERGEFVPEPASPAAGASGGVQKAHDARGRRRLSPVRLVVLLVVLLALAGGTVAGVDWWLELDWLPWDWPGGDAVETETYEAAGVYGWPARVDQGWGSGIQWCVVGAGAVAPSG